MENSKGEKHYEKTCSSLQAIELARFLDFDRGNVIKYCVRAGMKEGETKKDDLLKAQGYINDYIMNVIDENDRYNESVFLLAYAFCRNSPSEILKRSSEFAHSLEDLFMNIQFNITEELERIELEERFSLNKE